MFTNINDFFKFKTICLKENIEYHIYTIDTEKTLTVVLKRLIRLSEFEISNNLKSQGLNPMHYTEILIHTKYLIYRIFALKTTLTQVNYVRYVENLKIY